ncbi:MAG: Ca2+:H+ antiporter, partial [Gaiellales bacterium]|nr:Ca2+:H+ antiporter [Gaiellales bacterium]
MTRSLNRFEGISVAMAALAAASAGALALIGAGNTAVFVVSALALVALAWNVGMATEQLGESAGPKIGGVLNATFGNAAELIITIFAIQAGEIEVAKASITGSILGNTLLVLGLSFLVGGFRNGPQTFNKRVAGMNASMLTLAVIGLGIPTLFDRVGRHANVQAVSDVTAAILLVLYVLMLVFFFRTPEVGREGIEKHAVPHWPARLAMSLLLLSTGAVAVIADVFVG